jgi:hypothetical protein
MKHLCSTLVLILLAQTIHSDEADRQFDMFVEMISQSLLDIFVRFDDMGIDRATATLFLFDVENEVLLTTFGGGNEYEYIGKAPCALNYTMTEKLATSVSQYVASKGVNINHSTTEWPFRDVRSKIVFSLYWTLY